MHDGDEARSTSFSRRRIGEPIATALSEILDGWPADTVSPLGAGFVPNNLEPGHRHRNDAGRDATVAPDPFDPLKVDPRGAMTTTNKRRLH